MPQAQSGAPLAGIRVLAQSYAGAAAHTGDTVLFTFATIVIKGGTLPANGSLVVETSWTINNNANSKQMFVKLGGTTFMSPTTSTTATARFGTRISNRGVTNSQIGGPTSSGIPGTSTGAFVASALDMTVDQTLLIQGLLTNAADSIALEGYTVRVENLSN